MVRIENFKTDPVNHKSLGSMDYEGFGPRTYPNPKDPSPEYLEPEDKKAVDRMVNESGPSYRPLKPSEKAKIMKITSPDPRLQPIFTRAKMIRALFGKSRIEDDDWFKRLKRSKSYWGRHYHE